MTAIFPFPQLVNRTHLRSALRLVLPALVVLAAAMFVAVPSAHAADLTASGKLLQAHPFGIGIGPTVDPDVGAGNGLAQIPCADTGNGNGVNNTQCLPIFRWTQAMTMESNVEFTLSHPFDSVQTNIIQKNLASTYMNIGNFCWMAAAILLNLATNYTIGTTLMEPMNRFAATVGDALMNSALMGMLAFVALLLIAWGTLRRGFQMRRVLALVGSISFVAILIGGSMADSGNGSSYRPGAGSPAWIAQTVSKTFTTVTDPIANSVAQATDASSISVFSEDAKKDPYSCYNYVESLYRGYEKGRVHAAGPEILSRWWMNSAYKTFAQLQYGENSTVGPDYAACHQLEINSVEPKHQVSTMKNAVTEAGGDTHYVPVADSIAFVKGAGPGQRAQQISFWALCAPAGQGKGFEGSDYGLHVSIPENRNGSGGTSNAGNQIKGGDIGGEISGKACSNFVGKTTTKGYGASWTGAFQDFFSSGDSADKYKDIDLFVLGDTGLLNDEKEGIASVPALYEFEGNLTGADRNTGFNVSAVYAVSAFVGAVAICSVAIALFVMKTLSQVMAFMMILAALAGTLSLGGGATGAFLKQWLGYTLITSITNLLLSLVFMMTSALTAVADLVFTQAVWKVLWVGIAPLLAIMLLNWCFRKFFKARSPFSLRGMQSYASSPASIANSAAVGSTLLGQGIDAARRHGSSVLKSGWDARKGKGTPEGQVGGGTASDTEVVGNAQDTAPATDTGATADESVKANASASEQEGTSVPENPGASVTLDDTIGASKDEQAAEVEDALPLAGSAAASALAGDFLLDHLTAHDEGSDLRRERRGEALHGAFDAVGDTVNTARYAGMKMGDSARVLGGRLTAGAAAIRDRGVKGNVAAALRPVTDRWKAGAATRQYMLDNPGVAASYLARRTGTKLAALGRGAKDAVSGMDRTQLLKGAALYGGLTLATGGVGAPAALFAGKALYKHRDAIKGGFGAARQAIGGSSREAYESYFPGKGEASAELQFRTLQSRIDTARVQGVDGKAGIAADGSDQLALADDLPLGRERMIEQERATVEREYDVFAEQTGRQMNDAEREAVLAQHPFARDVMDSGQSAAQRELDLPSSVISGHSNRAADAAGATTRAEGITVQGDAIHRQEQVAGDVIDTHSARLSVTEGAPNIADRAVTVEHAVETEIAKGPDTIRDHQHDITAVTPGRAEVRDTISHRAARGSTRIAGSTAAPSVETLNGGSSMVGSARDAGAAARRAGLSDDLAETVARRTLEEEQAIAADAASTPVTEGRKRL